ncbi:MAG TPA: histidine phosphatase family protein [Candidatus Limnocylindrales bacterium]
MVLARHGESTFVAEGRFQGAADAPLSPLGERQAALLAERLAAPERIPALPIPPSAPLEIVHSPLGRTTATASAVRAAIEARGRGVPSMRSEPGFTEIGQGRWEGRHRSEIEAADGDLLRAWRTTPLTANAPGGERVIDAAGRSRGALEMVVARLAEAGRTRASVAPPSTVAGYPGPAVADVPWTLLVGHDGIFKTALLLLLDLPLDRFWTFPFALCGITVVEFRDGRGILRAHNLVEHLAPLATVAPPPVVPANGAL